MGDWLQKMTCFSFFLCNVILQLLPHGSESASLTTRIWTGFVTCFVQIKWNGSNKVPVPSLIYKNPYAPPLFGPMPLPWDQTPISLPKDKMQLQAEPIYSVESPTSTCPYPTPGDHRLWVSPAKNHLSPVQSTHRLMINKLLKLVSRSNAKWTPPYIYLRHNRTWSKRKHDFVKDRAISNHTLFFQKDLLNFLNQYLMLSHYGGVAKYNMEKLIFELGDCEEGRRICETEKNQSSFNGTVTHMSKSSMKKGV